VLIVYHVRYQDLKARTESPLNSRAVSALISKHWASCFSRDRSEILAESVVVRGFPVRNRRPLEIVACEPVRTTSEYTVIQAQPLETTAKAISTVYRLTVH